MVMTDNTANGPGTTSTRNVVAVAVDGSEGSRTALRWAAPVAQACGATLHVVQAWEYPPALVLPTSRAEPPPAEDIDDGVRKALDRLVAEELREDGPRVAVEVLRGPPTAALLGLTTERTPRMLVMGTRGLGGFMGMLLGSVSRHCIEHAAAPVVLVPEPARARATDGLGRIVVGVDGSAGSDAAVGFARRLAADAGASLTAVHAFEPTFAELPPEVMRGLRNDADQHLRDEWCAPKASGGATIDCVLEDGDARQVLTHVVEDRNADLLVVGAVGRGPVAKPIGPVASYLASHTAVPLAVVRQPD
jgi:nucleotide-binding universal stress UspA family protein